MCERRVGIGTGSAQFAYGLLGADSDGFYSSHDLLSRRLAANGIRPVLDEFRITETPTLKSGKPGKTKVTYAGWSSSQLSTTPSSSCSRRASAATRRAASRRRCTAAAFVWADRQQSSMIGAEEKALVPLSGLDSSRSRRFRGIGPLPLAALPRHGSR
jgi:hypothetical protein